MRWRTVTAPYRCPTSCDDDCEINGWGCHEAHDVPTHREHDPGACEARTLEASLRWLLEAGWQIRLQRHDVPERFYSVLLQSDTQAWSCGGVSPGEVLAKAREWSEQEGATPTRAPCSSLRTSPR